jgi:hypothetical protein
MKITCLGCKDTLTVDPPAPDLPDKPAYVLEIAWSCYGWDIDCAMEIDGKLENIMCKKCKDKYQKRWVLPVR